MPVRSSRRIKNHDLSFLHYEVKTKYYRNEKNEKTVKIDLEREKANR